MSRQRVIGLLGLLAVVTAVVAFRRENAQPWQAYQRQAYRLQASQPRAVNVPVYPVAALGASSVQPVPPAHAAPAAQPQNIETPFDPVYPANPVHPVSPSDLLTGEPHLIQVVPTQTGKPELCLTCHAGIEEISAAHPVEAFGCVVCHGGDPLALDKDAAHAGLIGGRNPSRLDVAAQSCGQANCHGGYTQPERQSQNTVDRVLRSLQATYASGIAHVRYTFGAQPSLVPLYGVRPVSAMHPAMPPALPHLDALPDGSQSGQAVDDRLQASCLTGGCHLWTPPRQEERFFRGEGCSACHVRYDSDGIYRGGDATVSRTQPGHPSQHRLTTAIPYTTCDACHNRGNYDVATMTYTRRDDLDPARLAHLSAPERRYLEYYQPIGQFTLCEWKLDCVDCHTQNEVMGDGELHGKIKDSQVIQCQTCHGTLAAPPVVARVVSEDDPALRQARANGNYRVQVGDELAVTRTGEKLPNVKKVGERFVLTAKVTGQQYTIPLVGGSQCQEKPDEQASSACHACHDDSGRR